jgi:hypothetical protein
MKANKAKTSKKAVKKVSKRTVKKELETSISDKFLEALKGLGHDAGNLTKEIKKASRVLADKLSDKYHEVKIAVEEKIESNKKKKAKKEKKQLTSPKKSGTSSVVKAEKVVAKAITAAAVKAKASGRKTASTGISRKVSIAKPAPKAAPAKVVPVKLAAKATTVPASKASSPSRPALKVSSTPAKKAAPLPKKIPSKAAPVKRNKVKIIAASPSIIPAAPKDTSGDDDEN